MTDSKQSLEQKAEAIKANAKFYLPEIPPSIDATRSLLERYSHISREEVDKQIFAIREQAWRIFPYGGIGSFRFLDMQPTMRDPTFQEMQSRLSAPGSTETFLDLGCQLGLTVRLMAVAGVDQNRLFGTDLEPRFLDLGYDLFKDRGRGATYVAGDILKKEDVQLEERIRTASPGTLPGARHDTGSAPAWILRSFRERRVLAFPVAELAYLRVLNEVLLKPRYWEKLNRPGPVAAWRRSRRAGDDSLLPPPPPDDVFALLVDELHHIARELLMRLPPATTPPVQESLPAASDSTTPTEETSQPPPSPPRTITPTGIHGVYISDNILEPALLARLRALAAPLEATAAEEADPSAAVLNLVHPSPHALVYGRTLVAADPAAVVGFAPAPMLPSPIRSQRFQWLPAEVDVGNDGDVVIRSYINNLEPAQHGALYGALDTQPFHRMRTDMEDVEVKPIEEYAWERFRAERGLPDDVEESDVPDLAAEYEAFEHLVWHDPGIGARPVMNWPTLTDYRRSQAPVVSATTTRRGKRRLVVEGGTAKLTRLEHEAHVDTATVRYSLRGRRLQVIFKLACVRLTEERPRFEGGQWHIEGMENEAIAATAVVYYDVGDGVGKSRIAFRHVFDNFARLERLFGFENKKDLGVQECGTVVARAGRCVVFPNFLQHRVEPFELAPGAHGPAHCYVLALFLVHPDAMAGVYSTRTVPPQQRARQSRRLTAALKTRLPGVAADLIAAQLVEMGAAMDPAEARSLAEELSEERRSAQEGSFAHINRIYL
ncbi:hypothetical protein HK405_005505, partial [Cladochytrium tenue]